MKTENISDKVRRMSPTRYTVNEAAARVGRSPDTLRRWRLDGTYMPSDTMQAGSLTVYLYTDQDLENLKRIAKKKRPGRKKKDG